MYFLDRNREDTHTHIKGKFIQFNFLSLNKVFSNSNIKGLKVSIKFSSHFPLCKWHVHTYMIPTDLMFIENDCIDTAVFEGHTWMHTYLVIITGTLSEA